VALTLLNHDGTVRTTHTVRLEESFTYYRIHASDSRANYPYVDAKDGAVSYYEQSVHLLACGLPLLPVMLVKPEARMLATEFWNGVGVWLVRNPEACDGTGGAALTFHQTGPRVSEHVGIGLVPTDLAALAVRAAEGSAIIVDEMGGTMTMIPVDVSSRTLGNPVANVIGEAHGVPISLHPLSSEDGWLVVRIGKLTDGTQTVSTWSCATGE